MCVTCSSITVVLHTVQRRLAIRIEMTNGLSANWQNVLQNSK